MNRGTGACRRRRYTRSHGTTPHHDNAESKSKGFWPAAVHVIGKDIIWFHCVIWPTILMSAGLPLPES